MGACLCKDTKKLEEQVFDPIVVPTVATVLTDDQRAALCKRVAQVTTGTDELGRGFVNEYTILRPLGAGTFGVVHLCQHYQTAEQFAIKVIPRSKAKKANVEEANILKKLRHHNVIRLFELMDDASQDSLYMILEFVVDGAIMSLDGEGRAKTPPLAEAACAPCIRQVLEGLAYLHAMNVIHRDIKPDNILVDRKKDVVKLCDFGVGKLFAGEDDLVRKTEGTPFFLAPEACRGEYYSGKASDIWQLGVTLFALAFGQVAFLATNQIALFQDIQHKPLAIPPAASADLSHLLRRMLEKNAVFRISLSEIKDHPWITGQNSPVPHPAPIVACASTNTSNADLLSSSSESRVPRAPPESPRGHTVLVVEDVFLMRKLCRRIVESVAVEGKVTIHEACDGTDAVAACRAHCYHVIIMDIHMPTLNGFDATAQIRALQKDRVDGFASWIVGLTGDSHESVPEFARVSGMNEVLRKPATPASIRLALARGEVPLRDSAAVGFKPRAVLKDGPRDLKRRGHASITAYEQFLRKEGEAFAEGSQCSGSELDPRGGEGPEKDVDQRSVATSSRSSVITGWVYQEPDLVPAATSQFLETIRGLQCQAEMVLAPRFYAGLRERVAAVAMAVIRRQAGSVSNRIIFDERMLLSHMEADLIHVKHILRQAFGQSPSLHNPESLLMPIPGIPLGGDARLTVHAHACRGTEAVQYQCTLVVPALNVLVTGAPLQLDPEDDDDAAPEDSRSVPKVQLSPCVECVGAEDPGPTHLDERAAERPKEKAGDRPTKAINAPKPRETRSKERFSRRASSESVVEPTDDALFGLFDGHGAPEAAVYARDLLPHLLAASLCYPTDLQAALIDAYRVTDKRIREWLAFNHQPARAGTTAAVVVLRRDSLWVTNAGDTRALLVSRDFTVRELTDVHVPTNEVERHIVQKRGGAVTFKEGAWRVNGELLVTRILGASACRRVVTCHPHVVHHRLNLAEDRFVLLVAGVWSVMTVEEVSAFLRAACDEVDASIADLRHGPPTAEAVERRRASVLYGASRQLCDPALPPLDPAARPRITPTGSTLPLPPNCIPIPELRICPSPLPPTEFKDGSFGKAASPPPELQSDYLLIEDHHVIPHALVLEGMARGCGENMSVVLLCLTTPTFGPSP